MTTTTMTPPPHAGEKQLNPAAKFRRDAVQVASVLLTEWVGPDRAHEATGRISAALAASAASARDPRDFYSCTIQSIGTCIAISALTGIMPGVGSTALAYVVPQRPRKDEPPQLQYSLSHRGLNALARRCGQTMVAVPIGTRDGIEATEDGDVEITHRDIDNPPLTFDDLRGVVIVVKEISSGVVLCRGWVPKTLIEQRRAISRSFGGSNPRYSPWSTWPVEMAMKAAMHYAVSRGWCVIDDTSATRALNADVETDYRVISGPQPAPLIEDGRSASDKIADRLAFGTDHSEHNPHAGEEPPKSTATAAENPEQKKSSEGGDPFARKPGEDATTYYKRLTAAIRATKSTGELEAIGAACQASLDAGALTDEQFDGLSSIVQKRYESLQHAQQTK